MTSAVGQLEQEIQELETSIASIRTRVQALYLEYAQVIAQAARKQMILATYQVCTRIYPSSFLGLTLTDRQFLQSQAVDIADQLRKSIRELFTPELTDKDPDEVDQILNQAVDRLTLRVNDLLFRAKIVPALVENGQKVVLRLAEIEFTDRNVMSQRGELRVLTNRLHQLKLDLAQKRQTKLTIEAEEAWRSTWTESL